MLETDRTISLPDGLSKIIVVPVDGRRPKLAGPQMWAELQLGSKREMQMGPHGPVWVWSVGWLVSPPALPPLVESSYTRILPTSRLTGSSGVAVRILKRTVATSPRNFFPHGTPSSSLVRLTDHAILGPEHYDSAGNTNFKHEDFQV